MNFTGKMKAGLMALAVSSCCFAADFEDGYKAMQQSISAVQGMRAPMQVRSVLAPMEKTVDRDGNEFLHYEKQVDGVKVYGEKKVLIFPEGSRAPMEQGISDDEADQLARMQEANLEPQVSSFRAFAVAMKDVRDAGEMNATPVPEHLRAEPELFLYRVDDDYRLVWHIVVPAKVHGFNTAYDYFVDAETEQIVDRISSLIEATGEGLALTYKGKQSFPVGQESSKYILQDSERNLNIYNDSMGQFSKDADGTWDDEGTSRKTNQLAEVELYLNFMKVVDYYKNRHGIVWQNGDSAVKAVAHVKTDFDNAYFSQWEGGFFFGDGSGKKGGFDYLTKGLDVIAHEFTHGIESMLSPLAYNGESGALNEHIADMGGAWVDDDEWMIGDALTIGDAKPLRNMKDPAWGYAHLLKDGMTMSEWRQMHKDNKLSVTVYPTTVGQKIECSYFEDNGGVHLNCSIFNRFAYFAATGDGLGSKGLGRDLLADIYIRMMKDQYNSNRCTFKEFKENLMKCAKLHLKNDANGDEYLTTLEKAFAKIGL
jgi:Zn-dependent metalloprotease